MPKDERDPGEETPSVEPTDDRFDESAADAEVEIEDREALERATEEVSEADADDDTDDVEEPTNTELAALTEPVDERTEGELVGVGAGSKAKAAKQSVAKKGRATPKRDGAGTTAKRTGPVTFVKESVGELRKVVYPTGPQLLNYFIVVLIFVLFIIAFVSVLDLAFGWAILRVFS